MSGCLRYMKKISTLCGFHPPSSKYTDVESGGNGVQQTPHQILYQAAKSGDWETAKKILDVSLDCARNRITKGGERVLHIAATGKYTSFVRQLVNILEEIDLELKNDRGCTAFCYAVVSGVEENAKVMCNKNKMLPIIRAYDDMIPIYQAALLGHKEMVSYLYTVTPFDELAKWERIELLEATIRNDMYDVALKIFRDDTSLAIAKLEGNRSLLNVLARKLQALTSENEQEIWERFIASTCAVFSPRLQSRVEDKSDARTKARQLLGEIWNEYCKLSDIKFVNLIRSQQVLHRAAKEGNVELLDMILQTNPHLLYELNDKTQSILHVAVLYRQEKVVRLIFKIPGFKDFITLLEDEGRNNILHLAAMTATTCSKDHNYPLPDEALIQREKEKIMPQSLLRLSTAALQFEREISWFKEMEKIVPPSLCDMLNDDDKTPKQLFSKEHMSLKIEGEKSIRNTANSCMLVATLIATVAFAAAFTVPGGNDDHTGIPIFRKQTCFTVFTMSDAVAMIYSMMSIVTFLSILILRYTEDNFHVALHRLLFGLGTLCVSIGGMLVAFTAAFFSAYNKAWQPIVIAAFAGAPVGLFLLLNTTLWLDAMASILRYSLRLKHSITLKLRQ